MSADIPADIRRFIDQNVASVAQLEILLLLQRHRDRDWSAQEAAKELYIAQEMAAALLAEWAQRGRLKVTAPAPRYQYRAEPPEFDTLVQQLAELYRDRRVTVITTIYAKPVDRVQTFADAFRLRGDKP